MNLKMKFATTALALGTSFANAQVIDFELERKQNPVGGHALSCMAIGQALNIDWGKSHPQYDSVRGMLHTATKTALNAYDSPGLFNEKLLPATLQAVNHLQENKLTNDTAYQKRKLNIFSR